MATPRRLLVTGATGKQGGALISALLQTQTSSTAAPFEIYALTRDKTSRTAQSLASKPNVTLIQGSFDNVPAIMSQIPHLWGLFLVTTFDKGVEWEEETGKAMARAAVAAGARHVVFTSTDRGVDGDHDPTPIDHFGSKFNVEREIRRLAAESGRATTWTFLRPVAFMDNMSDGFFGRAFVSMWRVNGEDRKLQLVSTRDIGKVAAEAFRKFDDNAYRNTAISLAGDSISPREAEAIFKEETGLDMPSTYSWLGRFMRLALRKQLGVMFDWFKDAGFASDVQGLRQRYAFMTDFRTWLREESAWKKS